MGFWFGCLGVLVLLGLGWGFWVCRSLSVTLVVFGVSWVLGFGLVLGLLIVVFLSSWVCVVWGCRNIGFSSLGLLVLFGGG